MPQSFFSFAAISLCEAKCKTNSLWITFILANLISTKKSFSQRKPKNLGVKFKILYKLIIHLGSWDLRTFLGRVQQVAGFMRPKWTIVKSQCTNLLNEKIISVYLHNLHGERLHFNSTALFLSVPCWHTCHQLWIKKGTINCSQVKRK